jgi:predicted unusual protein kinase regulating ubiquinone biosynthesis (AarF/ABC1/UbiB family)
VKVQRPNLPTIVARDVQVMEAVAEAVMDYPSLCRHTNWPAVVQEFAQTTFEELDYIREGRNADRLRHNFRTWPDIYIPRIIWRLTTRRIITLEYVHGAHVSDAQALRALGVNRKALTDLGTNFYLRQLLEDGFFHADPHPGNLRIMADGRIGIFDFGMVGRLGPEIRQSFVSALMHVLKKDYQGLVDDFVDLGFVAPSVDKAALVAEVAPLIEERLSRGLSHVQFRKLLFDIADIAFRYPFHLPTELTYVMRALAMLEGLALTINPDFSFLEAALPYAQRLAWTASGAEIREAMLKEVFADGRFQGHKAISLLKAAVSFVSPDLLAPALPERSFR